MKTRDKFKLPPLILVIVGYEVLSEKVVFYFCESEALARGLVPYQRSEVYLVEFEERCGMSFERFEAKWAEKIFLHEVRKLGELFIFCGVPDDLFERLKAFWG